MGHEIAREVQLARQANRPIAFILPVGPMGMYRWTVYFLTEWGVPCDHVHGFNMDEWSDAARQHAAAGQSRCVSICDGTGVLRSARQADGPGTPTALRRQERAADLRRPDRRPEEARGEAGDGVRHRPGVPHRLLGAALRRRVRLGSRVESPNASPRREAPSADGGAERVDEFPQPNDAGAGASPTPSGRPCSWQRTASSAAPTASSTAGCSGRGYRCV